MIYTPEDFKILEITIPQINAPWRVKYQIIRRIYRFDIFKMKKVPTDRFRPIYSDLIDSKLVADAVLNRLLEDYFLTQSDKKVVR